MNPVEAQTKCKNFLTSLMRLAEEQVQGNGELVRSLAQDLLDEIISIEEFANCLQKNLNSARHPALVPFLKRALPYLRYYTIKNNAKLEGLVPPPNTTFSLPFNSPIQRDSSGSKSETPAGKHLASIENVEPRAGSSGEEVATNANVDNAAPSRKRPANVMSEDDKYYVTGKKIAYQLKSLSSEQRVIAEKLISDVMFWGAVNKLSPSASVQLESSPSPSASPSPTEEAAPLPYRMATPVRRPGHRNITF